ncbi:MAG: hypothetical protein H0T56_04245 [Pseudaminobacter sp.]|nr:hypothetical protein [Pseudaminobacter sp.]
MRFDIPREIVFPVDGVDVRLDPAPHPYESAHPQAIDRNWSVEKARNPALFDGTVVLLSDLSRSKNRLEGRCHAIRFATFMHWRANRADGEHVFAHAMLVCRDNALLAIRMGAHTVNAGRVYFAAGSFEPVDFVDGVADVDSNMVREVAEETGLDISAARRGLRHHVFSSNGGTVIFRRFFIDEDADELARRIRDFVDAETDPEIDGPVIIRHAADLPDGLMPHMPPLIDWHFSTTARDPAG